MTRIHRLTVRQLVMKARIFKRAAQQTRSRSLPLTPKYLGESGVIARAQSAAEAGLVTRRVS